MKMPNYVDRDALRDALCKADAVTMKGVKIINNFPTADARPVVRAHWYWDKDGMDWGIGAWRCSACKNMSPMWWNTDKGSPKHRSGHNYCPNCGSDMWEGEDGEERKHE